MFIRLKELVQKANTVHIDEIVDLSDALKESNDTLHAGPLHVILNAQCKEEAVIVSVSGQLSVDVEQPCSRCLDPVKQTLVIPFYQKFARAADKSETDNEDDDKLHFVTDDKIELLPYVMENVMLALPYIPMCDENCLGLCPVCGVNRNLHACDCNHKGIDPRLAGLADFFKQE